MTDLNSIYAAEIADKPKFPAPTINLDCEIAIIGGGFTGMTAALTLAENGHDVILVEADVIGSGGSGRNGGHVCQGWSNDFHYISRQLPADEGNIIIDGENIFQGRIIEVHIGTLLADQAFTFTDWTAEMKAKASICISQDETLIESLEIAKSRIQIMIDKGMDNDEKTLSGLIEIANNRINQIKSGEKPALAPDENAKYFAEVVIDLDVIDEPMIADPDVNNDDVSKRYTHDTIRPISYYEADKKVDLGFVGSCMVHKGDMKILARMLKNIEANEGTVDFKAPLVVAPPTYNIVEELKAEGDWDVLQKYAGFEFNDDSPKSSARVEYENILYLERPGCNLCMGNQEKAGKGDTVMATSTRLFQGRVVGDAENKKGESLLASTPVVVLSTILGRTPSIEEYKTAVKGIDLTKFAPPAESLKATQN